jgi:putative endonuclease
VIHLLHRRVGTIFIAMAFLYILFSKTLDSFYVGSCDDLVDRLDGHLKKRWGNAYTAKVDDWSLFFSVSNLHYLQARQIERHIKRMKSKIYIQNLKRYSALLDKLINRFRPDTGSSR